MLCFEDSAVKPCRTTVGMWDMQKKILGTQTGAGAGL